MLTQVSFDVLPNPLKDPQLTFIFLSVTIVSPLKPSYLVSIFPLCFGLSVCDEAGREGNRADVAFRPAPTFANDVMTRQRQRIVRICFMTPSFFVPNDK